ncbi:hypothetical protein ACTL6U_02725 [Rhodovibrionaceae bacterium A322]
MHEIIQAVEDYWRSLCSDDGIAAKADFDIIAVPAKCWPSVSMVEVEYSPRRYRYVVFGSANVKAYGMDITGLYLDELDAGGKNQKYAGQFDEAVDQCHPIYEDDSYTKADGSLYAFEGGCFPLMGEDGRVSHLVLATALSRNHVAYKS